MLRFSIVQTNSSSLNANVQEIFFAWASRDQKITTLLLEFLASVSIQCYETRAMWTSSQDTCQATELVAGSSLLGRLHNKEKLIWTYLNLFGSKGPQIWWAVANWWSIQHPNFDLRHARPEQDLNDPIGRSQLCHILSNRPTANFPPSFHLLSTFFPPSFHLLSTWSQQIMVLPCPASIVSWRSLLEETRQVDMLSMLTIAKLLSLSSSLMGSG